MSKFDWKSTLATVAPVLATALGGPLAGVAVKMATEAIGFPGGGDESDLIAAISTGDPMVLLQLKQGEENFNIEMKRLDVEIMSIDAMDRGGARHMAQSLGFTPQALLSTVFVGGFFIIFGLFMQAVFDGMKMDPMFLALISALIGIMATAVTQIMNFWFGSSVGSKQKTDLLGK